jgi:gliding motility-associated-like protein
MGTPSKILFLLLLSIMLSADAHAGDACSNCGRLIFKENKGQWDKAVLYKSELHFANVYLEKTGILYQLFDTADLRRLQHHPWQIEYKADVSPVIHGHAFKAEFIGSNPTAGRSGTDAEKGYYNYFLGKDKTKWASNVLGYHVVVYKDIYQGIDLQAYSVGADLKYDWIIRSGSTSLSSAHPAGAIQIKYDGVDAINISDNHLIIRTSVGTLVESEPYAYQEISGQKVQVQCRYIRNEAGYISFDFPAGWDSKFDLVIDPTLIFSTYSGSTADNFGYSATYDQLGYAYVAGSTFGIGFPVTTGAFQATWYGGYGLTGVASGCGDCYGVDVGITKYAPDGSSRIFSTYLGGDGDELPHSLIVNANNELFVFGTTASNNFPVTPNAFDTTFNGGPDPGLFYGLGVHYLTGSDIFITHFNAAGTALLGSTYLGGTGDDGLNFPEYQGLNYQYADEVRGAIDLDPSGNVYIASCTKSADFPTTPGAYQTTLHGTMDGVVVEMDDNLTTMIWGTYLGGSDDDACYSLTLDNSGNVFVCGGTQSPDFPSTAGVYQTVNNGGRAEGFISLVNKNGNSLIRSTLYGTPSYDQLFFVQTDRYNNVYVLGETMDTTSAFTHNAAYNVAKSGQYISKFNYALDTLVWSTRFGTGIGRPDISPTAFLVDVCNSVYVSGWGSYLDREFNPWQGPELSTTGLYVTGNAYQPTTDGQDFYVMVMKDDASAITYATYFGSATDEEHVDGGTSRFDKKGVIYQAICAGCADSITGYQPDQNLPTYPANVVSHTNNSFNCNNAVFKLNLDLPAVVADFNPPPTICDTFNYQFINNSKIIDTPNTIVYWNFGDGTISDSLNPTHAYTSPGVYTITLIISDITSCNGSDTVRKQMTILKNDSTITLPTEVACLGYSVQIGIPPINDTSVTFQWYPTTGLNNPAITNPRVSPTQSAEYELVTTKGNCHSIYKQQVMPVSDSLIIRGSNVLCPNDTIELFAKDTGGQSLSYFWTPAADIVSGAITDSPFVKPPKNTTFYVTATDSATGCVYKDSINVNVISSLQYVLATATPDTIKYGDTTQLNTIYTQAASLYWDPDSSLLSTKIANPLADPRIVTTYTVHVIDNNGCKADKQVTVYIEYTPCSSTNLYVPNAFSPNNDGKNDMLYVRGNFIQTMYFTVYDRWGQKMFETRNQNEGWDGTYKGKKLDPAVFGWYVEGTCEVGEKFFKKGNVTLLR